MINFYRSISQPRLRRWGGLALLMMSVLLLAGCDKTGQMYAQPRYNPLAASDFFPNGQAARNFPQGSVAYAPDGDVNSPAHTGMDASGAPEKGFPVTVDANLLAKGQERFGIYCVPCHGVNGEGNGKATQFGFPKPPSLLTEGAKALSAGEIFAVIQNGKGKMFSYGYRVKPAERWAVIAYIRALQLKNGPVKAQDLTADDLNQIGKIP